MKEYISKILISVFILLLFIISCDEFVEEKYTIEDNDAVAAGNLIQKDSMIVANDSLIVTLISTIIDTSADDTTFNYDSTVVEIFPGNSTRKFKLYASNPSLPERIQKIVQNLTENSYILPGSSGNYLVQFSANSDTILFLMNNAPVKMTFYTNELVELFAMETNSDLYVQNVSQVTTTDTSYSDTTYTIPYVEPDLNMTLELIAEDSPVLYRAEYSFNEGQYLLGVKKTSQTTLEKFQMFIIAEEL